MDILDPESQERLINKMERQGVSDTRVLEAMGKLDRSHFIPEEFEGTVNPYANSPYTIGFGQTISQPIVVGMMSEQLDITPGCKVLEIGTGSGYQAAVLATMGANVFSIETIEDLYHHAKGAFERLGLFASFKHGDGVHGWPEEAPFDRILMTCAPTKVPEPLIQQLADGGFILAPLGRANQTLCVLRKVGPDLKMERGEPVRFVPLVSDHV